MSDGPENDPIRIPLEWTDLLYVQQKAVCRFLQEKALDILGDELSDADSKNLAKFLEAAAQRLGREAASRERRRKRRAAQGPLVQHRR